MKPQPGVLLLALSAPLLVAGGCACRGTDLIAAGKVTAELRIDRSLRTPPEICAEDGELVISGRLERGLPRDLGGHIDVTVLTPDGATVYDARVNYCGDTVSSVGIPAPRHSSFRRARTRYGSYGIYSVRFPGLPPDGSVVKVRHDPAPHTEGQLMRIELLGFPDCPMTPALRSNVQVALTLVAEGWEYEEVNQETLDPGDIRRGWPAPTLLVNGRDLLGMPAPAGPSMGCRVYEGGVPSPEQIAVTLRTLKREGTSE
ncbi:MAG: hypothetical protein KF869_13475 [Phycisphaeraceae bacterium]|nr:hypothetical protein [Phycisphaeraceae bacterium]